MIRFFNLFLVFEPFAGAINNPIPIPAVTPMIAARAIFEPELAIFFKFIL
jgi:hypothetical protein